jgi:aryl-alcohol dehydrogenase-like predicted oxidoreductase
MIIYIRQLCFPELGTTVTALALAWIAKNPNTSTVILGASKPEQVLENLKALEVIPKLTPEVMEKIEKILDNKPEDEVCWSSLSFQFITLFFSFFFNDHH